MPKSVQPSPGGTSDPEVVVCVCTQSIVISNRIFLQLVVDDVEASRVEGWGDDTLVFETGVTNL